MNVTRILKQTLDFVTPNMHKIRRTSLFTAIESTISGNSLSVTALGRNSSGKAKEKHRIKRVDRLCSNRHIQNALPRVYEKLISLLVLPGSAPIIHVDWSDMDSRKQNFLIRASLACHGRSLTLYEEVYCIKHKEAPATHKQFMETLKSILPRDCKPIVVSDAGFRVPWFKLVESLGWDYVGRVRNKTLCRKLNQETRCLTREFYKIATTRVKNLGPFLLTKRAEFNSRLVIIKKKGKSRKNLLANKSSPRLNSYSLECAKSESEPWLLATSLNKPATKIVKIYATRMQIEESFRDLKTGLNMNNSNTRRIDRMQVLLAIAAISQYFLYVLGIAVKLQNGHFQY